MTDNDIIKALEDAKKYKFVPDEFFIDKTLDLINHQKAEIERLETNCLSMAQTMPNMAKAERAEAVKEFAERLKEYVESYDVTTGYRVTIVQAVEEETIDNLVKEMAGEIDV